MIVCIVVLNVCMPAGRSLVVCLRERDAGMGLKLMLGSLYPDTHIHTHTVTCRRVVCCQQACC